MGTFWISGYRKEIYVWNIENNTINTIKNFSSEFDVYDFNNYMGGGLDCKKNEYEIFEILEEETEKSLQNWMSIWYIYWSM